MPPAVAAGSVVVIANCAYSEVERSANVVSSRIVIDSDNARS